MLLNTLLLALLILVIAVLALVIPTNAMITLLIVAAIVLLGVIVIVLLFAIRSINRWINGEAIGQPGQVIRGVDAWVKQMTFASAGSGTGSDPDMNRPTEPPPKDI